MNNMHNSPKLLNFNNITNIESEHVELKESLTQLKKGVISISADCS